jgi:hypothetical protein
MRILRGSTLRHVLMDGLARSVVGVSLFLNAPPRAGGSGTSLHHPLRIASSFAEWVENLMIQYGEKLNYNKPSMFHRFLMEVI